MPTCATKTIYYTRADAQAARDWMYLRCGFVQYVYQCPVCGWFHLSKTPPQTFTRTHAVKATAK